MTMERECSGRLAFRLSQRHDLGAMTVEFLLRGGLKFCRLRFTLFREGFVGGGPRLGSAEADAVGAGSQEHRASEEDPRRDVVHRRALDHTGQENQPAEQPRWMDLAP